MPLITNITQTSNTRYKVSVKPDGSAAAGGKIYAGDKAGNVLKAVGTWEADDHADGEGDADTGPGVFLRAEQNNVLSEPVGLPQVLPSQPQS